MALESEAPMWLFFSIPVIFIVLGVLIWLLAANPTVKELGWLTAQAGLIGLCFSLSGHYFPHR
jgi:succinate-acetate transporter protein